MKHRTAGTRAIPNTHNRPLQFPLALSYGIFVTLFSAPYLLGLAIFSEGDFTEHFLPFSIFQQNALLSGLLPLWNPYVNAGHPFLADAQSAVFYPVSNILLLLTGFERSVTGRLYWLQVEAALHLFLACNFTYLLVRRLTGQRMAGFGAGLVFGFSGFLTGYPPLQLGILRTSIWLPLILWLLLPSKTGRFTWTRWLVAAAVHAIAFFAGHPQTFLLLSYTVGGWMLMLGIASVIKSQQQLRASRQWLVATAIHVGRVVVYGIVLIVLSLAQLWPALEFTSLSVRSSLPYEELSGGFPLIDTWQLLLPGVLTHFSPLYISIAGLGLILFAITALLSPSFSLPDGNALARPSAFFFLICGGVALLASYGGNGPLYPLLYRFAPGWYLFRGQERVAYLIAFSLSVLSGYGLALLPSLPARWRRYLCWGFLIAAVSGVVVFLLQSQNVVRASLAELLLLSGKMLIFAMAFAYLSSRRHLSRTHLLLLFPLLAVDLVIANYTTNLANRSSMQALLARQEVAATTAVAHGQWHVTSNTTHATGVPSALPARVYNEFRLPKNMGMFNRWEDVWGASPLRLSAYDRLFVDFPQDRMWQLTGVGTVLTWRPELFVESQLLAEFPQGPDASNYVYKLNTVAPRLWWTQNVRRVDDETAVTLLADHSFDLQSEVLIATEQWPVTSELWPVTAVHSSQQFTFGSGGTAALLQAERKGPAHLHIQIESTQPGLLFVSENWMPGWQAVWDRTPVASDELPEESSDSSRTTHEPLPLPVLRAHQAFLGVPVPAGVGTLELVYRPVSVRWGVAVSGIGWILLLFAVRHPLILAIQRVWRTAMDRHQVPGPSETPTLGSIAIHSSWSQVIGYRTLLLLILLLGFALRLFRLDFQELRGDEAFGYFFSLRSLAGIVQETLTLQEPHPVGSYFLQHVWYAFGGTSEFALRTVPALAGTAAIPLLYWFARQMRLGVPVALLSSFLMAVSAYAIWHSQDARMYTLSLALTLASSGLALEIVKRPGRSVLVGYILCTLMTLHIHYFAAFVLLAQNLYILLTVVLRARDRHLWQPLLMRWGGVQCVVAALYIPWLLFAWQTLMSYGGNGDSPALEEMLWRSIGVFILGESGLNEIWRFHVGILAAGILVAGILTSVASKPPTATAVTGHRPQVPGHYSLIFYLFVPLLATWASALERPIFNERYLIAALPPFLILFAIGVVEIGNRLERWLGWRWRSWVVDPRMSGPTILERIPAGHLVAASLVSVIVVSNLFCLQKYYFDPAFSKTRGWRELAATLERWSSGLPAAKVRLVQNFPDPVLWYYYKGDVEHIVLPPGPHDTEGTVVAVESLRDAGVQRILLPVQLAPNWDPTGIAQSALSTAYRLSLPSASVGVWPLQVYTRPDIQRWNQLTVGFTNGLELLRVQIEPDTLPTGGLLIVHMDWTGDPTALTGGEKIFLHLLDETGTLLAQFDPPLPVDSFGSTVSYSLSVPSIVPVASNRTQATEHRPRPDTGSLRLVAGVYDPTLPGAPRILTNSGEDSLLLADFPTPVERAE